jgi:hypothetical protein
MRPTKITKIRKMKALRLLTNCSLKEAYERCHHGIPLEVSYNKLAMQYINCEITFEDFKNSFIDDSLKELKNNVSKLESFMMSNFPKEMSKSGNVFDCVVDLLRKENNHVNNK